MVRINDEEIAKEFKNRLVQSVPVVDIRLYGSRGEGRGDEYSDFDIFVEVEKRTKEIKDRIDEVAWEVGIDHLIHISPVVFTRAEIEESPLRSSPLVVNVLREGVPI